MKKVSKILAFILMAITIVISNSSIVNANPDTNSAKFSLTSSTKNIKVGDEIEINIVISSITGFNGISTFTAKKIFDSSTFEYIGSQGKNGWIVQRDNGTIIIKADKDYGAGTTIGVLKFKALKATNSTVVKLTQLDATSKDGVNDVYYDDGNVNSPEITFKISEKETTSTQTTTQTSTTPTTSTSTPTTTTQKASTQTSTPITATTATSVATTQTATPIVNNKTTSTQTTTSTTANENNTVTTNVEVNNEVVNEQVETNEITQTTTNIEQTNTALEIENDDETTEITIKTEKWREYIILTILILIIILCIILLYTKYRNDKDEIK
jgi:hypothetical protein